MGALSLALRGNVYCLILINIIINPQLLRFQKKLKCNVVETSQINEHRSSPSVVAQLVLETTVRESKFESCQGQGFSVEVCSCLTLPMMSSGVRVYAYFDVLPTLVPSIYRKLDKVRPAS